MTKALRQIWAAFRYRPSQRKPFVPMFVIFSKADALVSPTRSMRLAEREGRSGHRGLTQSLQAAIVEVLIALDAAVQRARRRVEPIRSNEARYISYAPDMHVTGFVLQTEVLFNSKGVTHDHPF